MMAPLETIDEERCTFLDGFGFANVIVRRQLEGGMFSRPFLIEADGRAYVLRGHAFRGTVESFRFQAEILSWAADRGVPCARVVRSRDGCWCRRLADGSGVLALHEYIAGNCDSWGAWQARKDSGISFLAVLGSQVARMHDVLRTAPIVGDRELPVDLPPIQFDRLDAIDRQWNRDLDELIADHGSSAAVRQLATARGRICEHWRTLRAAIEPRLHDLPRQVVHGDVSPVNLVLSLAGEWTWIDWDCMHVGWRLYDALGDVLNRAPIERPDLNLLRTDHVQRYVDAYGAASDLPLSNVERSLIPVFCLARQLEDLRQRVRVLPQLDLGRHADYATLIARRVEMLDQISNSMPAVH